MKPQWGGGKNPVEETKKFTFTVKGDFTNAEFSDVSPNTTRANTYMTADGSEMTDLWIVDYQTSGDTEGSGTIKQMLHQSNTDQDWGSPIMNLTLGTHHIYFLASRGQNPTYNNGIVTWTKPLDTFYLDYEVTVVKTSNGNRAVTLNRVATKLTLYINDAIPEGTTSIDVAPTTWYNGYNMLTGETIAADNYVGTINIPQSFWLNEGTALSVWSLSGSEEWSTDLTITSKAGSTTNATVVISGAPFKANRTTTYRGNLYSNNEENSVSLNTEWLTSYEGVY